MLHFMKFVFFLAFPFSCVATFSEKWQDLQCPTFSLNDIKQQKYNGENEVEAQVWYMPLYSKYELYHTSSLISGIPVDDLTENDIQRACLTMSEEEPGLFVYKGFNGQKIDVATSPADDGGLMWKLKGEEKFRGELYVTLATDDFSVTVTCWGSGHKSFSAASKTKKFDSNKTLEIIIEHVKTLGFNPKHFVYYNYTDCGTKQEVEIESDEDGDSFCSFGSFMNSFWKMFGY